MIIANPIYDVVFKRLMENESVAKFFIGTLLDITIEAIEVQPQEFTFLKDLDPNDPAIRKFAEEKIRERLSINVFRLDFIATVKTENGERKKILIEIQKARNPIDVMRFRNYLAEQYKKEDVIENEKIALPITTIYILGFSLPEIETPCIKVQRTYHDLINKTNITTKSEFIEKLTHDCFVVQVERITDRYQTRLDKLLSIFEQQHFTDDRSIIKNYRHTPDLEEIKTMTDILHHAGTDPEKRKQLEIEQEAWRTINAMFGEKEQSYLKQLAEKDQTISEKEKALSEKEKALNEKDKQIAELLKKLNERG
ncbi:MAG: hypothetical protein EAZ92_02490 [Candidatus Kapaibacterium sp.]|nr:MAG: hypothetical protein EAZ92_02490 [Candidatus Kapabacteria bacterium]